jgi:hypothetical protein
VAEDTETRVSFKFWSQKNDNPLLRELLEIHLNRIKKPTPFISATSDYDFALRRCQRIINSCCNTAVIWEINVKKKKKETVEFRHVQGLIDKHRLEDMDQEYYDGSREWVFLYNIPERLLTLL